MERRAVSLQQMTLLYIFVENYLCVILLRSC